MTFDISRSLHLPEDAALWSIAELAIRGAGKTYAASVMAEEFVKAGIPIVCIDGLGVWWGLRVGVEGHEGLPIVIFGGSHKDISIPTKADKRLLVVDEERLKLMVKAILEARMSAVLDTSEFSKGMQRRIVAIFVNELYHLNREYGIRHVFIEEADLWCPQRIMAKDEWAAQSAGAIDDLVRRGGNFNLGCTLITQRAAVLNKDVLTQANCLIVLRILHKLDKQAVHTWVESMARPDDPRIKKWYDSLKGLKNGEAWVWHPEEPEIFEKIQFRQRETLHATREYFRQAEFEQKDIHMMPVEDFVERFRKVFEPVKKEPVPVAPRMARDIIPSSAPKPLVVTVHQEQGLGSEFQAIHDKVEDEMDAGPEPETKELASFTLQVTRLQTSTLAAKVIFILKKLGHQAYPKEVIATALEYGWVINAQNFGRDIKPTIQDGLILKNEAGFLSLPSQVTFEEIPA